MPLTVAGLVGAGALGQLRLAVLEHQGKDTQAALPLATWRVAAELRVLVAPEILVLADMEGRGPRRLLLDHQHIMLAVAAVVEMAEAGLAQAVQAVLVGAVMVTRMAYLQQQAVQI